MTDADGHRIEAAEHLGFSQTEDDGPYSCTEAQLIAFAKAAERKGRAEAIALVTQEGRVTDFGGHMALRGIADELLAMNAASDAELAPILDAEEERFMTARGYVRATDDQPGARWVKPSEEFTQVSDCEVCGGDCAAANPPVMNCPRDECCDWTAKDSCPDCPFPETAREPCHYCGPGKYTGLPDNACENCMNTGLANPTVEGLK